MVRESCDAKPLVRGNLLHPSRGRHGAGPVARDPAPRPAQGARATRAAHRALLRAADQVARGERSFVLFPERHRSRDGELQRFMAPGLALIAGRASGGPVYVVAADGLTALRSFADSVLRM